MKYLLIFFAAFIACSSCNSQQQEAKKTADAIKTTMEKTRPGTMPASEGGWTMTATINGKAWKAASLMPPEAAGRIIGYSGDEYLGLPYSKNSMKDGHKFKLGENDGGYSAEYFIPAGKGIAVMTKGEMLVTKAGDGWAEGTFSFTSTYQNAADNVTVSNGFFKVKTVREND